MRTGFLSGCFDGPDGPHDGHKYILNYAKLYCDELIVGLNADWYIREKKKREPFLTQEKRKGHLYDLGVDKCLIIGRSPFSTIKLYKPDYVFVGNDYDPKSIVGYKYILKYGGKVIIVPRVLDISTTKIWNQIKSNQTT